MNRTLVRSSCNVNPKSQIFSQYLRSTIGGFGSTHRGPSEQGQRQKADGLLAAVGVLLADFAKADRVVEQQRCLVARTHVHLAEQLRIDTSEPFDDLSVERPPDAIAAVCCVHGNAV